MIYYSCTNLSNGITVIQDAAETKMYLIEGTEAAVLIDTGVGFAGLRKVVESITSLPVIVLLTHGHLDHAGGIHDFEEIYISKEDIVLLKSAWDLPARIHYANGIVEESLSAVDFSKSATSPVVNTLCNNQQFSLGNRTLTAVHIPGHTKGSYVYFDSLSKSLFLGDACNPLTFLFLEESTTIEEYLQSLQVLGKMASEAKRLFCSHRYGNLGCELPKVCIDEVVECCKDILEETDDGEPFDSIVLNNHCYHPHSARKLDFEKMRADGKVGNVIYERKERKYIQK